MSSLRVTAAALLLLLAACEPSPKWPALHRDGDAAREQGDLAAALDRYRRALIASDLYGGPVPKDAVAIELELRELIQSTAGKLAEHELASIQAQITLDPDATIDRLRAFAKGLDEPRYTDWDSLGYDFKRDNDTRVTSVSDEVKSLDRFTGADLARLRSGVTAAADVAYDALLARVEADGYAPSLAHAAFLVDPLPGHDREGFGVVRALVASRETAAADAAGSALPGLAAWHARVARHFDPSLDPREPSAVDLGIEWTVSERDACTLAGAPESHGGTAAHAEVQITCASTQSTRESTKTTTEHVTEDVPETNNVGSEWVTETETVYDTVVGQEQYDCSTGNERKFCTRAFSRQVPHNVNHLKQRAITETKMTKRERDVSRSHVESEIVHHCVVHGGAHVTWAGGAIDVPLDLDTTGTTPAHAREAAAEAIRAAIGSSGGQIVGRQRAAIDAQVTALRATDPRAALDLALQWSARTGGLDDGSVAILASQEHLSPALVVALFTPAAARAAAPAAPDGAADVPPGITAQELDWASALEGKVNTGYHPTAEETTRYADISKRAHAKP
jgi:hypothetical protein